MRNMLSNFCWPYASLRVMSAAQNPIVSEFPSEQDAATYDAWLRQKVQISLADADSPASKRFASDDVARKIAATIEAENAKRRLA